MTSCEAPYIETLRAEIERQYDALGGTGCGGSFGEVLCYELHTQGRTFAQIAQHWGVSLPTLGDLIADHCRRLEELPRVAGIRGPDASGPREGAAGRVVLAEPRPHHDAGVGKMALLEGGGINLSDTPTRYARRTHFRALDALLPQRLAMRAEHIEEAVKAGADIVADSTDARLLREAKGAIDRCEALRERFGLLDAKLLESYATIAGLERQLEETRNALFHAACNAPSATEGAE